MTTILDTIVAQKRTELAARQAEMPLAELVREMVLVEKPRRFAQALATAAADGPAIIAEVKRGSPSLGCLRPDLNAARQAAAYAAGGAAALSVLTDRQFFFGKEEDLRAARAEVALPVLRKDFVIDEYQVYETRALGADCLLLIMAILTDAQASRFARVAHEVGLDVLAEAHDADEVRRVLNGVDYDLLGINSRDLKTFQTSEAVTLDLAVGVPDRDRVVAESGLREPAAVARLWRAGIKRFLIGEAFVKATDPAAEVRQYRNRVNQPGA